MIQKAISAEGLLAVPGLIDLHTHIREQGKGTETIETATEAAKAGGFAYICMMPNTIPPIDSVERLRELSWKIKKRALVSVLPIPSIAIGESELADIEGFAKEGVFAISDDGHSIHNLSLLREACFEAKRFGLIVILHAEYNGEEPKAVEKRIELAYLTGASIHIAHISTEEGVKLVREAKKSRINVTTEATPHHFTLTENDIKDGDTNFKVNPRLKSEKDREALKEGLFDGTIDIIATDHAPHTRKAKEGGWENAASGMVGLETCVGLVWTELVHKGVLSERSAIEKLTLNPAKIIGRKIGITEGEEANLVLIDPNKEWVVNPSNFKSAGRNTPFSGRRLKGKVV
ncbi:dihydroorotase [bacterium]|nr:dihydroorotase [bacterium]MBU2462387.1 dihydroorotase [bacterium]